MFSEFKRFWRETKENKKRLIKRPEKPKKIQAIVKSGSCKLEGIEVLGFSDKEWEKYRSRSIATVFQEPGSALNPLIKVGKQIEEVLIIHYDFDKIKRKNVNFLN